MKKLLLTVLLIISSLPACAFENYMIVSEAPFKSAAAENPDIVSAKPVFTIDNKKKIILITPHKSGKTKINILFSGSKTTLDIKITNKKTTINPQDGFEYFKLDEPPEGIEILPPPTANGGAE